MVSKLVERRPRINLIHFLQLKPWIRKIEGLPSTKLTVISTTTVRLTVLSPRRRS
jgi:hypothetical protein